MSREYSSSERRSGSGAGLAAMNAVVMSSVLSRRRDDVVDHRAQLDLVLRTKPMVAMSAVGSRVTASSMPTACRIASTRIRFRMFPVQAHQCRARGRGAGTDALTCPNR